MHGIDMGQTVKLSRGYCDYKKKKIKKRKKKDHGCISENG